MTASCICFSTYKHQHNDKFEHEPLIKTQINYFQYWRFRLSQMWTNARIHLVLAWPAASIRMEVTRAHAMMATPVTEKIAKVCLICLLSLIVEQNGFAEMAAILNLFKVYSMLRHCVSSHCRARISLHTDIHNLLFYGKLH